MEAEEIAKNLMDTLKTLSEMQSAHTRVIDKMSDRLLRAVNMISVMQTQIENLEKRVKTLEKEAKE